VFHDRLPQAERYVHLLATAGTLRGLIGPREVPRLWTRHLLNCAVAAVAVPRAATVCDIGSGAGLPGLVWALLRPDLEVTLLEPLLRRTTFLEEAVVELELTGRVRVVRGRAEALHQIEQFDVVTSRAVAPLGRLLDWSMPLVRPDGVLLALKGSSAADELAAATEELARHGATGASVLTFGADVLDPPTTVVRVEAGPSSRLGWTPGGPTTSRQPHGRGTGRSQPDGGRRRRPQR
jgi:16S rRNA (guanine527-N7)-methyltransferase